MSRAFVFLLVAATAWAQNAATPDFSGTYTFLKDGETLQLNLNGGKLDGFVSRFGDLDSDRGVLLDHFFDKTELKGNSLRFTTKPVHSVWFEFTGKVERGPGKLRSDEKYYLLKGKLIRYHTDAQKKTTAQERAVVLESLPEGLAPEPEP